MTNILKYKNFIGSIEINTTDMYLYGKLLFINDVITYEANSLKQLRKEFEHSVNDYLATCKKLGREPQKPFKGSLNIRIGAELHKQVALTATLRQISINNFIKQAVQNSLAHTDLGEI